MRYPFLKFMPIVAAASILLMCNGCGGRNAEKASNRITERIAGDKIVFPLEEEIVFTYWRKYGDTINAVSNYNEMRLYQELEKRTNVKVDFIHPVAGQEREQFNIMLASGDYPDIIEESLSFFAGGIDKAYKDNVIISLDDLMEEYAPNLWGIYEKYPFLVPQVVNETGQYLLVPMMRGGDILKIIEGPIIRKDWLLELGFDTPETIDDWEIVLKAFKKRYNLKAPLGVTKSKMWSENLIGAYNINFKFFMDEGKVKYGAYEPNYKDFLRKMNQWYEDELIDSEFVMLDNKMIESRVLNNEVGIYYGARGGQISRFLQIKEGEDFDITGIPYPVLEKGNRQTISCLSPTISPGGLSTMITTVCKRPEVALKWIDYAFGKDGHMLFNFGIEGESYEMIDGYPTYTRLITNNPDGKTFMTAGMIYSKAFSGGPFIQDTRYGEQYFSMPAQQEAREAWTKHSKYAHEADRTVRGALTHEETQAIISKLNQINTFVEEYYVQFIMGTIPLDKFDEYIGQLEAMGIEEIIATYQKAHDRFVQKHPNYLIPYDFDISKIFYEE